MVGLWFVDKLNLNLRNKMNTKNLIYISYHPENAAFARILRKKLLEWGWRTWMDVYNIPTGAHRPKEIEKGLKAADQVIAVMSPMAVGTEHVLNEWDYAIVHEKRLITLLLEACELPSKLSRHPYIAFQEQSSTSWETLEVALNYKSAVVSDPYLPYLQKLYKRLNTNLAQKVISRRGESDQLPDPMHLRSSSTPEDVDVLFAQQSELDPQFEADGLSIDSQKQEYDNFENAFAYYEGQVLLLGEPGSGKTITLLQFARDAVVRRIQDPTQKLPMFAILPEWLQKRTPEIADWMAQTYDAPADTAELIRTGQTLLMFDGLDELGERAEELNPNDIYSTIVFDPRARFMQMLRRAFRNPNKGATNDSDNQVVVTCRVEDYRRTGVKIGLKGAVILKKLESTQITRYLMDVPGLQELFEKDEGLLKIAETPLLLSLIAYAFREKTTELEGLRDLKEGALRDTIFNAYLRERYQHEQHKLKNQPQKLAFELEALVHDLGWIAMVNAAVSTHSTENVLSEADFWRVVGSSKSRSMIAFCQQINLIAEINATTWRFTHLKLRDTLAYGRAAKIIKSPPIDPRLFQLAGEAVFGIKDKRLTSELLTKPEDQRKLLQHLFEHDFSIGRGFHKTLDEALEGFGYFLGQPTTPRQREKPDPAVVEQFIYDLYSDDPKTLYTAINQLGRLGDPRAVDGLLAILKDKAFRFRREVVTALGRIRDARAIDGLLMTLDNADSVMRSKISEALGRIGGTRAVDYLLPMLQDGDALVRETVVEALGRIGNVRARQGLVAALGDVDRDIRLKAAQFLEGLNDTSLTESWLRLIADTERKIRDIAANALESIRDLRIVDGLIDMLGHESSVIRAKAAETLGEIGNVNAVEPLLRLLNDADKHVQVSAVRALSKIDDARATEPLMNLVDDDDKKIRAAVVEGLGRLGDARAIKPLLKAVNDPSDQVCANAAKALGNINDTRVLKSFLKALSFPDIQVRNVAVNVLIRMQNSWAITGLLMALKDTDADIRYRAASALGTPGNNEAIEGLVTTLDDNDVHVRRISAKALGRIGHAQAVEKLLGLLSDTELDVCSTAIEALGRIGDADCLLHLEQRLGDERIGDYVYHALLAYGNEKALKLAKRNSKNDQNP